MEPWLTLALCTCRHPCAGDPAMPRPHIVIVGGGFGGLSAAVGLSGAEPTSPSSTGATITSSSRCSTKWPPPGCRRRRSPSPSARSCAARQRARPAGQGRRRRQGKPHHHGRRPHAELRLSRARDRGESCLFRSRRLGARGSRPEDDRRCHRHPPPHPGRLRECRGDTIA